VQEAGEEKVVKPYHQLDVLARKLVLMIPASLFHERVVAEPARHPGPTARRLHQAVPFVVDATKP
jgi:hypothetical protein